MGDPAKRRCIGMTNDNDVAAQRAARCHSTQACRSRPNDRCLSVAELVVLYWAQNASVVESGCGCCHLNALRIVDCDAVVWRVDNCVSRIGRCDRMPLRPRAARDGLRDASVDTKLLYVAMSELVPRVPSSVTKISSYRVPGGTLGGRITVAMSRLAERPIAIMIRIEAVNLRAIGHLVCILFFLGFAILGRRRHDAAARRLISKYLRRLAVRDSAKKDRCDRAG